MNFCSACGAQVAQKIPPGDNRLRYVCDACHVIHYQNPKIVAGCIPAWEDKVLLCKRAIEPRYGYWTLPAGFMELDETSHAAAVRETLEEANAKVEILNLFAIFNLPEVSQVYMIFNSNLLDLNFSAGAESQEVSLFSEDEIPWDELAFLTIRYSLKFFFEDQKKQSYQLHTGDIIGRGANHRFLTGPKTRY